VTGTTSFLVVLRFGRRLGLSLGIAIIIIIVALGIRRVLFAVIGGFWIFRLGEIILGRIVVKETSRQISNPLFMILKLQGKI
jgi:uncharacterized sodium:solute symporter family permease YidK